MAKTNPFDYTTAVKQKKILCVVLPMMIWQKKITMHF